MSGSEGTAAGPSRRWTAFGVVVYSLAGAGAVAASLYVLYRLFFEVVGVLYRIGAIDQLFSWVGFFAASTYAVVALVVVYAVWMLCKVAIARTAGAYYQGESEPLGTGAAVAANQVEPTIRWAVLKALATAFTGRRFGWLTERVRDRFRRRTEGNWELVVAYVVPAVALDDPDDVGEAIDAVERRLGEPLMAPSVFGLGLYVLPLVVLLVWTALIATSLVVGHQDLLLGVAFASIPTIFLLGGVALAVLDTVERTKQYVLGDLAGEPSSAREDAHSEYPEHPNRVP